MKPRLCVLLVEDDPTDAVLLERELRRGGYDLVVERVETAAAMDDALDRLIWDAIICDYCLPMFSATAVLDTLKARNLDVPVIIVSGTIDDECAVISLKAGACDFMTKDKLARLLPALAREVREARVRSEHRRVQASLRESDDRYRMVAEHASDAILITDDDGTIEYANPATEQIFGFARAQLIGQPFTTLFREPLKARDRGSLARHMTRHRGDQPAERVELLGFHKNGEVLRLDASIGSAVQSGRPVCICVLRDVSARHEVELHREHLYAAAKGARSAAEAMCLEAERASRAKSTFLATMSHELRTPLAAIIGYTELLVEDQNELLTSVQLKHLERIGVNSARLLSLINEVLTFSAVETGNTKYDISDVTLRPLVVAVADALAPSARKQGLTVTFAPHDVSLAARADGSKLQQVLSNVLGNAVKFTPPGGRIGVSCEEDAGGIRIAIRDNGAGIPFEQLGVIFDPFVQLDSSLTRTHGGVGLGLAISREFVRGMGGSLDVESTLGVGTTFTVTLPLAGRSDHRRVPDRFAIGPASIGLAAEA